MDKIMTISKDKLKQLEQELEQQKIREQAEYELRKRYERAETYGLFPKPRKNY